MKGFEFLSYHASFSLRNLARERRGSGSRWLFIVFFISFGLASVFSVLNIKNSLEASIDRQSRAFLGADLAISSRRDLTDREWAILAREVKANKMSHMIEVYSMVSSTQRSRLMQIRVIDEAFPFYGEISIKNSKGEKDSTPQSFSEARQLLLQKPLCWVYPEVLTQLQLKVGEELQLAGRTFLIAGVVESDSANTLAGVDLAPRIYVGETQVENTDLVALGSTQWHSYLVKVDEGRDLSEFRKRIEKALPAKELRIYTHGEAGESAQRLMSYLQDYLSLASLIVLFLSLIATWFILKLDLIKTQSTIAIQYQLGRSLRALFFERWYLYLALFLASYVLSEGVAWGALHVAAPFLNDFTRIEFDYAVTPFQFLVRSCSMILLATFFLFPLLVHYFQQWSRVKRHSQFIKLLSWVPLFIFLISVVRLFSHSLRLSVVFLVGIVVLFGAFSLLGYGSLRAVRLILNRMKKNRAILKLSLQTLIGRRSESILIFVTLGFSFCFIFLLAHIQKTLLHQIVAGDGSEKPSLFLFDIQDHQLEGLQKLLSQNSYRMARISPLIRGRVLSRNGVAQQEREAVDSNDKESQEQAQTRNRGYNLSYRQILDASESIIEGRYVGEPYRSETSVLPAFSAEEKFAERMGWEVGDRIEFEILGVPIEAQLSSIRRINWTSFQPNFFIQFQPGVLEEIPKTFIASLSPLPADQKEKAQSLISEDFPNISMIDVSNLIGRISQLSNKLATALQFMGLLSAIVGVSLLLAVLRIQTLQNRVDVELLELLGLQRSAGSRIYILQRLFLLFLTFAVSFGLSVGVAEAISWSLFHTHVLLEFASILSVAVIVFVIYGLFEWYESRS